MAFGHQLVLRGTALGLGALGGKEVTEAGRATLELTFGGELEALGDGLLGLLHGREGRRQRAPRGLARNLFGEAPDHFADGPKKSSKNYVDREAGTRTFLPSVFWFPSSMVEQLTLNQLVQGSSPWGTTTFRSASSAGRVLFSPTHAFNGLCRRRSSMVEHLFCKQAVAGSNPIAGSKLLRPPTWTSQFSLLDGVMVAQATLTRFV